MSGFSLAFPLREIQLDTLERVSGSFVSDDFRRRENDVIWRVRVRDQWLYVYLLLEFQSGVDRFMALRLMVYVGLLYQELLRAGRVGDEEHLPPVLPIVLYNGERPWTAARDVGDLVAEAPGGLAHYQPRLRYLLLEERTYGEADLAAMRNLAAALFRLEKSRRPEDVRGVVDALALWLREPNQVELARAFVDWLREILLPSRMPEADLPRLDDLREVRTLLWPNV